MTKDVIKAIDSEREYQEKVWNNDEHSIAEWLIIMRKCLDDALNAWVKYGDMAALDEIRQVTATGVAAMEQLGAMIRVYEND